MLLWKSWFDLRQRFFYSLGILLLLLATVIAAHPTISSTRVADPISQAQYQRLSKDYVYYINALWFTSNSRTAFYIVTILLALSGVPVEKGRGSVLMTLSLPVRRWLWVVTHAGMAALLILVLAFVPLVGIAIGSPLIGKSYPHLLDTLLPIIGSWLPCFPWIGLSLLLNSFLRSAIKSALIIIPFIIVVPSLVQVVLPSLSRWCPWTAGSFDLWNHGIPWAQLIVTLMIGIGSAFVAAYRFSREEY
jgi:ABC-type transport system involved in multi-copper enzyme maturation permease subunit